MASFLILCRRGLDVLFTLRRGTAKQFQILTCAHTPAIDECTHTQYLIHFHSGRFPVVSGKLKPPVHAWRVACVYLCNPCFMIHSLSLLFTFYLLCVCGLFFFVQQELVKHTHDGTEKTNLRTALDAMKVRFLFICSYPWVH